MLPCNTRLHTIAHVSLPSLTVPDDVVLKESASQAHTLLSRGGHVVVQHPCDQVTAAEHIPVHMAVNPATVLQTRPTLNQSTTQTYACIESHLADCLSITPIAIRPA